MFSVLEIHEGRTCWLDTPTAVERRAEPDRLRASCSVHGCAHCTEPRAERSVTSTFNNTELIGFKEEGG